MLLQLMVVLSADPEAQAVSCLDGRDPTACRNGGLAFAYGEGVEPDNGRAVSLFSTGCELGDAQACFLARLQLVTSETEAISAPKLDLQPNEGGIAALKSRCTEGKALACYHLGVFHDRGPMSYRDMSQATMLFRQACDDGVHEACLEQARDYASTGTDMGIQKATALLEASCEADHAPSCHELGALLVEKDPERAAQVKARACDLGDYRSCK